jgi:hypothetical protein
MHVCDGFRIGEWDVDNRVLNGEAIRSDCREGICVSEVAVSWLQCTIRGVAFITTGLSQAEDG